jgi:signal peptidase
VKRRSRGRPVLAWVVHTLSWVVLLGVAAVLVTAVLVPRVAGATPYTIVTGSMSPGMPPGTLVVVRPVDSADVGVGTVITYQLRSGEPDVVTHRVVAKAYDGSGRVTFQTRGDANSTPDAEWVRPVQIRGERWYSVRELGYVNLLLTRHERQTAVYVVAMLLGGYALWMFGSALRGRGRARNDGDPADHVEEREPEPHEVARV